MEESYRCVEELFMWGSSTPRTTKGITLCQIKKNYTNGYAVQAESIHLSSTENALRLFIWNCVCEVDKKYSK